MLSNGFDTTLHLSLSATRTSLIIRLAVHLLAFMALSNPLALNTGLHAMLFVVVISSLLLHVFHYHKIKKHGRTFCLDAANYWIENKPIRDQVWECQPGAIITPWFVIVTLVDRKDKQTVFISRDQCQKEVFRRLLVRLRFMSNQTIDSVR